MFLAFSNNIGKFTLSPLWVRTDLFSTINRFIALVDQLERVISRNYQAKEN
jgi:hypothetical protein